MSTLGASPFVWLEFDENGGIDPASVQELSALLGKGDIDDLAVISHGWKNDKNDATKLYKTLWNNACANFPVGKAQQIAVAGVLWPAKAYSTDFDASALAAVSEGGALAVQAGGTQNDLSDKDFDDILKAFDDFIGPAVPRQSPPRRSRPRGFRTTTLTIS